MDVNLFIDGGVAIFCAVLLLLRPCRLVEYLPFFLGWFFPLVAATVWSPYKIATVLTLPLLVLGWNSLRPDFRAAPKMFLFVALALTIWNYPRFANINLSSYTAATDARIRTFVQLFWTLAGIGASLLIAAAIRRAGTAKAVLRSFVVGGSLLAFSGLYEFVGRPLGLPTRMIWYAPGSEALGSFRAGEDLIVRIAGFGSEPKHLAKNVLAALCLATAMRTVGLFDRWRTSGWLILALGFVVVVTFSTSAWFALVAITPVTLLLLRMQGRPLGALKYTGRAVVLVVAIAALGVAAFGTGAFRSSIDARTRGRGTNDLMEFLVVERLIDSPSDLVTGYGPGNYSYTFRHMRDGEFFLSVMDSGWLTVVCDYGLPGAVLLLLYVLHLIRAMMSIARSTDDPELRSEASVVAIAIAAVSIQHTMVNVVDHLWLLLGCAQGLVAVNVDRLRDLAARSTAEETEGTPAPALPSPAM